MPKICPWAKYHNRHKDCSIKFRSKHSSNTILCLLRNLMEQTLFLKKQEYGFFLGKKVYVSSVSYLPTCIARLPRVTHIEQQKELVKLNL